MSTHTSAMRVPVRISPSSLIEAVIEVRFKPIPPPDAVFGMVYSEMGKDYPEVKKLPILQLPDQIRERDPDLLYQAHYRLENLPFALQIGPRVVSLTTLKYDGWDRFSERASAVFERLEHKGLFGSVSRIGLRYINLFVGNILNRSTVKVEIAGESVIDRSLYVKASMANHGYTTAIQLATEATVGEPPNAQKGSVIDLDTSWVDPDLGEDRTAGFKALINGGHAELKRHFFSLLRSEYLKTLNPEYND